MSINYKYRAKVLKVIDGDTVDLMVDCGLFIFHKIRGRLLDVDTPERGEEDFAEATSYLSSLLDEVRDEEGNIIIETRKTGKYGRWLITIEGVNKKLAAKWPYGAK